MIDRFEEILKELGQIIDLPLHVDKNRACMLNINQVLHVQMEPDAINDHLLIGSFLIDVPAGRFREDIFRDALKANHARDRIGTLGYSARNNQLFFFRKLSFYELTGNKLCDFLGQFINIADSWRQAIESGQSSPTPSFRPRGDTHLGLKL
jgi:hypothetical protein